MKRFAATLATGILLMGCAPHVAAKRVPPTSLAPTRSPAQAAVTACSRANALAFLITGPFTVAQLTDLTNDKAAMLQSGDKQLANFVVGQPGFDAAALRAILGECVALRYLDEANAASDTPPAPTLSVADPGYGQTFSQAGGSGAVTVGASKAVSFTSGPYGENATNGHYVLIVVGIQAAGQFEVNPVNFYVRTPDGTHYDESFMSNTNPPALSLTALNPGERATGSLVFDLPVTRGFQLVFAPDTGTPIGAWQY